MKIGAEGSEKRPDQQISNLGDTSTTRLNRQTYNCESEMDVKVSESDRVGGQADERFDKEHEIYIGDSANSKPDPRLQIRRR